ncbi:MAG: hypothetical protein ACKOX3_07305 [Bacteroidota bacterium]
MKIIRNIFGVVAGILIGSYINMFIVELGPTFFPLPAGVNLTTEEGLKAGMAFMRPEHFIAPFLAHVIGTFVATFIAAAIAVDRRKNITRAISLIFLSGGAYMVAVLPSPLWFNLLDLIVAYVPMGMLGYFLATKIRAEENV